MKDFNKELQMDYTDVFGGTYKVLPKLNSYLDNNNLYVGLDFYEEEGGFWAPYADVTVNVGRLPFLESAIDTNNNGQKIVDFLVENGFGELTDKVIPSGFCVFPVFRFNADKLKAIDSEFFKEYAKQYGVSERSPLNDQIQKADQKDGSADNSPKNFHNFLDSIMDDR